MSTACRQIACSVSTGSSCGMRRIWPTVLAGTCSSMNFTLKLLRSTAMPSPPNSGWSRVLKRSVSLRAAAGRTVAAWARSRAAIASGAAGSSPPPHAASRVTPAIAVSVAARIGAEV